MSVAEMREAFKPGSSLTDYEKAMLLLQMTQIDYLHIIAWANRNGPTNAAKIEDMPKKLGTAMQKECPTVVDFLREAVR